MFVWKCFVTCNQVGLRGVPDAFAGGSCEDRIDHRARACITSTHQYSKHASEESKGNAVKLSGLRILVMMTKRFLGGGGGRPVWGCETLFVCRFKAWIRKAKPCASFFLWPWTLKCVCMRDWYIYIYGCVYDICIHIILLCGTLDVGDVVRHPPLV
jgi:hypothetical protein